MSGKLLSPNNKQILVNKMNSSKLLSVKFKSFLLPVLTGVILFFSGCGSTPDLINLGIAKDEVINYHNSGRYEMETAEAIDEAIEKFNGAGSGENTAVVFDVDETAVTSYEHYKKWDFGYVPEFFDMWVDSAKAPAVPAVLNFYNYLLKNNYKIVFLTGRKEYQYAATFKNLVNAGYTKFDTLIVKGEEYSGQTAEKYKSEKRSELAEKGYIISGTVGDQWSDLNGSNHGIQVKIPNYMYIIY